MWCIEAKAKIDIPLQDAVTEWTNKQLVVFIKSKRNVWCKEFDEAIEWLGNRNYQEAIRDCTKRSWLTWLNNNLPPQEEIIIKQGTIVTVTNGKNEKYALWHGHGMGIWDLPEEYIGETIRIVSKN